MKIRIKGNSIRVRITRSELARLSERCRIEEASQLGAGEENRLVFALEARLDAGGVDLRRSGNEVLIVLPAGDVATWRATEQVGIDGSVDVGGGARLAILVEKDFMCLEGRTEDDDAFANPAMSKC